MKRNILLFTMMFFSVAIMAKNIKTVVFTTNPQMHCENCENKIKSNLRFEKGVKAIETNVENQTVTVKYDADKTTVDNLQKGFTKFGYTAKELKEGQTVCPENTEKSKMM